VPHLWEWLGEPLAADFANTTKRRASVEVELLLRGEDLEAWTRHERGRAPEVRAEAAGARLEEVRAFRADVRAALHALVDGEPVPRAAAEALNARVRAVPLVTELRAGGATELCALGVPDPLDELFARVAHSAIELVRTSSLLGFCDAPSCGQFFARERANKRWCSEACGTRARVARHAGHRRA